MIATATIFCSLAFITCSTTVQANVSYYTPSVQETDSSPCITANGTNICKTKGRYVAANWLPFGTKVEIDGVEHTVVDRMNRRYKKPFLDVLVYDRQEALKKGRQIKKVIIK